jgi:hypothetical protein
MPNSFQFINRETKEAEKFNLIDDKLCTFLGVTPDERQYHRSWYDNLGFLASIGKTFPDMLETFADQISGQHGCDPDVELKTIIEWFDAHYTINAWYSR